MLSAVKYCVGQWWEGAEKHSVVCITYGYILFRKGSTARFRRRLVLMWQIEDAGLYLMIMGIAMF